MDICAAIVHPRFNLIHLSTLDLIYSRFYLNILFVLLFSPIIFLYYGHENYGHVSSKSMNNSCTR